MFRFSHKQTYNCGFNGNLKAHRDVYLSMVQWPCWGSQRGCLVLSSQASDTRPISVENKGPVKTKQRLDSKKMHQKQFQDFARIHRPVWGNQGSTPACRPCRSGPKWRMISRRCTQLWCSSPGTCNQTVRGVVLSAESSQWYTEKIWDTQHFHIC